MRGQILFQSTQVPSHCVSVIWVFVVVCGGGGPHAVQFTKVAKNTRLKNVIVIICLGFFLKKIPKTKKPNSHGRSRLHSRGMAGGVGSAAVLS
jgi:hypothetical protein